MADTFYNALISLYLQDERGQVAAMPFYVQVEDIETSADMVTEGGALALLVNNVTGCQIIQGTFGMYLPTGLLRPSPAIGSRAAQGAVIKFQTISPDREFGIIIPAILESKIVGNRLNTADPDVAALINHLLEVDSPYVYTDEGGLALDTFVSSFLNFRKPAPHFRRRVSLA